MLAGEQQQALESGPARLGLDTRGVGSTAVVVPLQQLHRLHLERIAACKPAAAERFERHAEVHLDRDEACDAPHPYNHVSSTPAVTTGSLDRTAGACSCSK